jgi:hypothetical protein
MTCGIKDVYYKIRGLSKAIASSYVPRLPFDLCLIVHAVLEVPALNAT